MSSATKRETNERLLEQLLRDPMVRDMICRRAFEIYQDRGREHGHDREDWLRAENEILAGLIKKDELIEKDLNARLEVTPTDIPAPQGHQALPNYEPSTAKPKSPAAAADRGASLVAPAERKGKTSTHKSKAGKKKEKKDQDRPKRSRSGKTSD